MHTMIRSSLSLTIMFLLLLCASCKGPVFLKSVPAQDRTLYFVPPVNFKSTVDRSSLEPDFTYNHQPGLDNNVVLNFSVFSREPLSEINGVTLISGRVEFNSREVDRLFMEKVSKNWEGRFGTEVPRLVFLELLSTDSPLIIHLHTEEKERVYSSPAKWDKVVEQVYPVLEAEINN